MIYCYLERKERQDVVYRNNNSMLWRTPEQSLTIHRTVTVTNWNIVHYPASVFTTVFTIIHIHYPLSLFYTLIHIHYPAFLVYYNSHILPCYISLFYNLIIHNRLGHNR